MEVKLSIKDPIGSSNLSSMLLLTSKNVKLKYYINNVLLYASLLGNISLL